MSKESVFSSLQTFDDNLKHNSTLGNTMKNKLLVHWKKPPVLEVRLEDNYPLAHATGVPEAFEKEQPDWDMLRATYGPEGIFVNYGTPSLEWREVIIALEDSKVEEVIRGKGTIVLEGSKIDSFTLQAQERGMVDTSYTATAVLGMTRSPDKEHIILGIRGRSNNIGKIIPSPAGHSTYDDKLENPIRRSVIVEGNEEQGVRESEIDSLELFGILRESFSPKTQFLYTCTLNIPAREVIERHTQAMRYYEECKSKVDGNEIEKEIFARSEMSKKYQVDSSFPRDAWENNELVLVPNDPTWLVPYFSQASQQGKMIDSIYGAFALYFLHEFGEEEYGKLMAIPGFRENVDDSTLI